jgi:hypothetical protein
MSSQTVVVLVPAQPIAAARLTYYRGSDNHSQPHCAFNGASALSNGEYAIGFGEGDKFSATADFLERMTPEQATLLRSPHFRMSHNRWNDAKNMTSGDVLFMCKYEKGKPNSIYRGIVTSTPIFEITKNPMEGHAGQVIVRWKVNWTSVCPASQKWLDYLKPSQQKTLYALKGAPPA